MAEAQLALQTVATNDSILAEEMEKLVGEKNRLKDQNSKYLDKHPELHSLVDDFVASVLKEKPRDIIQHGFEFFSKLKNVNPSGVEDQTMPFVICGPSGVGKGTIIEKLKSRFPGAFGFSVSHTTRPQRQGEENGTHYNFVSKEDMEAEIGAGKFIEFARVHTNIYGTSFEAVESVRLQGKICILDIDPQGVRSIKASSMRCMYMFIVPPSAAALEQRLRGRATETDESIRVRLANSIDEINYGTEPGNFDAIVTNTEIDTAFEEVVNYLVHWYPQLAVY